jgi:hypothetical protein
MSITPIPLADLLREHVTLGLECIDRMYLNVCVPKLQYYDGARWYLRGRLAQKVPTSAEMAPLTRAFVAALHADAAERQLPVLTFRPGQRKEDVVAPYLGRTGGVEGISLLGTAQEKTRGFRTRKGYGPCTQDRAPEFFTTTLMVNHCYCYGVDADFGPSLIKFGSYFPFNAKVCPNRHEWLKRQLAREEIAYAPLDNGLLTCADPARAQALAESLTGEKIEAFVRKWLRRLPQPFSPDDQAAGYTYACSLLQMEFALTQVLDRPQTGRLFFEQALREHLDLGRPDQVALLFDRQVQRNTPGRFRTRVLTTGVIAPCISTTNAPASSSTIRQTACCALNRPLTTRPTRQRAASSPRFAGDTCPNAGAGRLFGQPAPAAPANSQPRPQPGRGRLPGGPGACGGGAAARGGPALWRWAGAGAVGGAGSVSAVAAWLPSPWPARLVRAVAGPGA